MYRTIGLSVLFYLALTTSSRVVAGRYTTTSLPDNPSKQETTPLPDTAASMPRDTECATEESGSVAIADAFHQVARAFLRVQEALRLQEQQAERSTQEALRLHEQRAATALREAVRQMEHQLQDRDGADRALRHTVQQTLRLQEQEAERRMQEALRQHEHRATTALQDTLRQMEHQLQERDETVRALRRSLNERIHRVEERLGELMAQPKNPDRDAQAQQQSSIHQLEKRMINLEATVKTVLEQLQLGTPMRQMAESPSAGEPHASPYPFIASTPLSSSSFISSTSESSSSFISSTPESSSSFISSTPASSSSFISSTPESSSSFISSTPESSSSFISSTPKSSSSFISSTPKSSSPLISSISQSSAIITASTTPQPPVDSALGSSATEMSEAVDEDREKKWVELRMRKVRARRDRARAKPSLEGEALCAAAFDGRVEDVRRLLDSGADVNYTSSHGTTPLIAAFYLPFQWHNANPDVLSLLVERRADVNAIDSNGWSALHYAAEYDVDGSCVAVLLGAGANVNARDDDGATPLHRVLGLWYLWSENETTARALLAAGAKKSLRCWGGWWTNMTPFDVAESVSADAASSRELLHLLRP